MENHKNDANNTKNIARNRKKYNKYNIHFSGYYRHEEPSVAIENYISDAKTIINAQLRRGRKVI